MAGLHAIREVLNQTTLKCKEAKDVRWLSHDKAIILTILASLNREASERGETTGCGLLIFIKSSKFLNCVIHHAKEEVYSSESTGVFISNTLNV